MSSKQNNKIILLLALRPREQYHHAAKNLGMEVVTLDPPDVIEHIVGTKTLPRINQALHRASLDGLMGVEKGRPILLDFSPIRTIAVEGKYSRTVGELTEQDINQYKADWRENWLPVLEAGGYTDIVVLADIADVDISAKVRHHRACTLAKHM